MDDIVDEFYDYFIDNVPLYIPTRRYDNEIRVNQQIANNIYNIRRNLELLEIREEEERLRQRNLHQNTNILFNFFNTLFDNTFMPQNSYDDVKITLNDEQFNKLKTISIYSDNLEHYVQKQCNICMDHYKLEDTLIQLYCNHLFHKTCIREWLCKEKVTCPVCRKDMRELDYNELKST